MKELIEKNKTSILLLFLFIPMGLYFYLAQYTNPIADDFTYAFSGKTKDLWTGLVDEYHNWNGRFTSNIFVLNNPIAFGYQYVYLYKLSPIILMIFSWLSIRFLLNSFKLSSYLNIRVVSLALLLIYLAGMPNIAEGIYWYTAAVTYQLGLIFFLIYCTVLYLLLDKRYIINQWFHICFSLILLIITCGFNEGISLYLLSLAILISIIDLSKKRYRLFVYLQVLFAVGIFLFILTAPGNEVREAYFSNDKDFIRSFLYSVVQTLRFSALWISAPLLILSILYIGIHSKLKDLPLFKDSFGLKPLWSTLLLFGIIFISVFPAYWGTGILGQHRTVNIGYFLFILMWFINLTVWINAKPFEKTSLKLPDQLSSVLMIALWFTITFSGNSAHGWQDIFYKKTVNYDAEMKSRAHQMMNHLEEEHEGYVVFNKISDPPETLFVLDITNDPSHWLNQGYNIYFERNKALIIPKDEWHKYLQN